MSGAVRAEVRSAAQHYDLLPRTHDTFVSSGDKSLPLGSFAFVLPDTPAAHAERRQMVANELAWALAKVANQLATRQREEVGVMDLLPFADRVLHAFGLAGAGDDGSGTPE